MVVVSFQCLYPEPSGPWWLQVVLVPALFCLSRPALSIFLLTLRLFSAHWLWGLLGCLPLPQCLVIYKNRVDVFSPNTDLCHGSHCVTFSQSDTVLFTQVQGYMHTTKASNGLTGSWNGPSLACKVNTPRPYLPSQADQLHLSVPYWACVTAGLIVVQWTHFGSVPSLHYHHN